MPFSFEGTQGRGLIWRYNLPMASPSKIRKSLLPRDPAAVGPQNAAERQVYDLVMAGMTAGEPKRLNLTELAAMLRSRIHGKR